MQKSLGSLILLAVFLISLFPVLRLNVALGSRTIVVPLDFPTVQEAINNATDGDQVFVFNGTYHENVILNKTIMLVGENRGITTIDGGGGSFGIYVSSNNVTISGFTIRNSSSIVEVFGVRNCNLTGNRLTEGSLGVYLVKAEGGLVTGNDISETQIGVRLDACANNLVENNSISDNQDTGIYVMNSSKVAISSNLLSRNVNQGLLLNYSQGNIVEENSVADCGAGIKLRYSSGNTLIGNNVTGNAAEGFSFYYSGGSVVTGNIIEHNGFGVKLSYSGNNTLRANVIASNNYNFGVEAAVLASFVNDIDTSNTVDGKPIYYLVNRKDFVMNAGSHAGYVALVNSTGITVKDLNLANNNEGLLCAYADQCTIENNTLENNHYGLSLYSSDFATVEGNTMAENSIDGLFAYECHNVSVEGNAIAENGVGMDLYSFANCSIAGNNVTNNVGRGIQMLVSGNDSVSQNSLIQNGLDGMYSYNSNNNTISGNQVIGNMRDGLWIDTCDNCLVAHNNVSLSGDNGINLLSSTNCQVQYNRVIGNSFVGILLSFGANGNLIVGNYVSGNIVYGISIYASSFNKVSSNNFLNKYQAQVLFGSSNAWDDGYPSGGNFWSDYVGQDLYWGQYQNLTGGDGMGDRPYVIDSDNMDRYPLMSQSRVHDVAIVKAALDLDQPYVGWTVDVNVTAKNLGDYVETFNVTVFSDNNVTRVFIASNLPVGASVTFDFLWNTSSSTPCHNYTITCHADAVAGETNLQDNTYLAGTVRIKMMGDVDGNGRIDILDIAAIAVSYQTKSGDSRYRLNRDLNRDGIINIVDVTLAAQNFGKRCT
jgi:parallel beta-helix repeat protein